MRMGGGMPFGMPMGYPGMGGGMPIAIGPGGIPIMLGGGGMMLGGGAGIVCKHCYESMSGLFDEDSVTESEIRGHKSSCPRYQEYYRRKSARAEAEARAAAERAEAERRAAAARYVAPPPPAPTRRPPGFYLERSASMISRRRAAASGRVDGDPKCLQIEKRLKETQPFVGTTVEGLITRNPTGQAVVLRAKHGGMPAALKVYFKEDEFEQERNILRRVGAHKNITTALADYTSPSKAIVFPLAEKGSLEDMVQERALPSAIAKQYAKQIAEGLVHLHGVGVAHLDIKAANILITDKNVPVVADFGFARLLSDRGVGGHCTFPFNPPESFTGGDADATKVDVWAFGMVIYEMLSGLLPWERLCEGDLEKWHRAIEAQVVAGHTPEVDSRWDSSLVRVMQACWEKNPARRPTMQQVLSMFT